MGSSAKKKHEKKKDFKKPKLKVGKARPKPTNFTDTSFTAKGIVLAHQSISTTAPTPSAQFSHHVSLLSSKQTIQRRDSLAHLTTAISSRPVDAPLPQPVSVLLPKLLDLVRDQSNGVRAQLLRLFRALPIPDLQPHVAQILLYTRTGLTHMAADICSSATQILLWIVSVCPNEAVSCAGGWVRTLKDLLRALHWHAPEPAGGRDGWSSTRASIGSGGKIPVQTLNALAAFLSAGIVPAKLVRANEPVVVSKYPFPLRNVECHMIPKRSNAFAYLNLFGPQRDEEGEMYVEREERQRVFHKRFHTTVARGVEAAKKEGGEVGRAAAAVGKALAEGMDGFEAE